MVRAGGGDDSFLAWAAFTCVLISGITTVIQSLRVGRIGAGYTLLMGTSGAFIAVSATAIADGGPGLLAVLVVVSSLFQFALAAKLAWFRRIFTPAVTGTVIMLIPVTIMPIAFDFLNDSVPGTSIAAAPVSALGTLTTFVAIALFGRGVIRLWAPLIGVGVGSILALGFGTYDLERVASASWVGLPDGGWPGLDLSFGVAFWSLLPAFIFVTIIGAVETIGDSVAIQEVAWRKRRTTDFRAVQGAVNADGVGNLLPGLSGTLPNTTYSSSIVITEITGVAARSVGIAAGLIFIAFSFVKKLSSLFLAIPNAVVAGYLIVILAVLFSLGLRLVGQDGVDYRKVVIVGLGFWVGVAFQYGQVFQDLIHPWWAALLGNGMTAGGITAILLTFLVELAKPRRSRIETRSSTEALPRIIEFIRKFARDKGWNETEIERLCATAEEAALSVIQWNETKEPQPQKEIRRLSVVAHVENGSAYLEFTSAAGGINFEDRISLPGDRKAETPREHEISLRLLHHYATRVKHQQYHDANIVQVRVDRNEVRLSA